ncbi:hypothetical protein [Staphylococcus hominis]|uniref:hypothetical protein n=1 Tax=Staphylococcus hominis TaxID=1290 RepID=UPI0034D4F61C
MGRKVIDALWDRTNLNNINDNFYELFNDMLESKNLSEFAKKILDKAEDINQENKSVQTQLDSMVIESGNSDAEIAQARGGYSLLYERLEALDATTSRGAAEQPDFVDKLSRLTNFDEIQIKKANESTFMVSNFNRSTGRHLTNAFTKNANDDYYILSESYIGSTTSSELPKEYVNYTKVRGTIDTTYATHYATEIGTKIKATLSGTELYLKRYGDNRGGIWEFTIDGDTSNKIQISTFKASAGTDDFKLIGGLADKVHLIEAVFTGNDPSNPPSGGVSRGWLPYSATSDVSKTFFSRFMNVNMKREKILNAAMSNKDFALRIRPKGATGEYHFVPEHNAVGSAFKISEPKFLLDGKEIDIFGQPVGISQIGKKFTLVQSVYGRYPINNANLLRIDNVHEVSINSSVRMLGKVSVLQDIDIQDGYFLMLPVSTDTATRLKTSRFNDYDVNITDGSHTMLTPERDDTTSYIFTSSTNTNLFSSMKVNDPYRSLRTGQDGKFPDGQTAWIEHRNSSMQKVYQSIYRLSSISAGTNLYYDGVYLSGEVPNVHNLF